MFGRLPLPFPPSQAARDKKAQLDEAQFQKLTENLKEPKLTVKSSEVVEGKEICEHFECLICKSIPIDARSCDKCDVLFCKDCLDEHKTKAGAGNRDKCPQCRMIYTARRMNANLQQITIEKLVFEHKCVEEEDDEHLTPFERFKRTPAYAEILRKRALSETKPAETEEAKDEEAPAAAEKKETKRASKRIQKQNEKAKEKEEVAPQPVSPPKPLNEAKRFGYAALVSHLRDDCPAQKTHLCPLNCAMKDKMTLRMLKQHLSETCPEMNLSCLECEEKQKRGKYKSHKTKTCISVLQDKYREQEALKPRLEAELAELQAEAARRREGRDSDHQSIEQRRLGAFRSGIHDGRPLFR